MAPPEPADAPAGQPEAAAGPLDPRREAEAALQLAKAERERVLADTKSTPTERARAIASVSQSIRVLSAVVAREPREPTEAEILASSTWQQINDRIEPALKPYPEAARAMMKALEGCK